MPSSNDRSVHGNELTLVGPSQQPTHPSQPQYRPTGRPEAPAISPNLIAPNIVDVVWIADPEFNIAYVSPSLQVARGIAPEALTGRSLAELLTRDSWTQARVTLAEARRAAQEGAGPAPGRLVATLSHEYRRPDGSAGRSEASLSHVCDDQGRWIGLMGVERDLSARAQADEERERSERHRHQAERVEAASRLARRVAHDFNNMFSVILNRCIMLRQQYPDDCALQQDLAPISNAAAQAAGLTRKLMAFSRAEPSEPHVVQINRIVEDLEHLLCRSLGEEIALRLDLQPSLSATELQISDFEEILVNLAVNARDAMPSGGRLTIKTTNTQIGAALSRLLTVPPGSYVEVTVTDTGCGMSPEVCSHAFEPFFTTKGPDNRMGFGLAAVYGAVCRAAGHIRLASAPGRGTTFRIFLPATDASVDPPMPPSLVDEITGGEGETIVVVEDNKDVRNVVSRLLERHNYRVVLATGSLDALEVCEALRGQFDLLLTDVIMPDLSGPALVERVARRDPDIRVLYMSGHTFDETHVPGASNLTASLLHKPFTETTLLAKVREALDVSV